MNTDELIALINELSATIRALREELSAMRADNEALRAELGLPVVEIPETVIPDVTIPEATPIKPDMSTPETKFPKVELADAPVTQMMVQSEDDYLIRTDPKQVETNYILSQDGPREFLRGTDKDDVFVDGQLEPLDFHNSNLAAGGPAVIDWDTALEFPELPNGSRINGLDGYDAVHLKAEEGTRQWLYIRNIEYLRVDFEGSGGEVFGDWELPDNGYVYIDGEFNTAAVYDDGFNLVAM